MKTVQTYAFSVGSDGLEGKLMRFRSDDLRGMQEFVGGDIEVVNVGRQFGNPVLWDGLFLVCNEMPNRVNTVPIQTPWCLQPIYGNFLLCRRKDSSFAGVTKEDVRNIEATDIGQLTKVQPAVPPVYPPETAKLITEIKALARRVKMTTQAYRKKGGSLDLMLQKVDRL